MSMLRKLLIIVVALCVIIAVWLWWNHPVKVDMAAYVPADSIVYLEANDLPEVLAGLTTTEAWRGIAPSFKVETDYGRLVLLSRFAAATSIGPSDAVALSRAQVALVALGFDAAERPDASLKLTPRLALVVETHSSEWRARSAAEKLLGDFARRAFNSSAVARSEIDGAQFLSWSAQSGSFRKLVAAIDGSLLVVGNDEAAVRACLAVKRGERPSLAGNEQLQLMRERLGAGDALAFGFLASGSSAKIVEVFAPVFVTSVSTNPQIQSFMASFLPQLANQIVGAGGWSAKVVNGLMEDQYFVSLPDGLGNRLTAPLRPEPRVEFGAGAYLPQGTSQLSVYSFADPALAWKGLNAALSSQVNAFQAPSIVLALEALLKPYGINEPSDFFKAAGPEIVTARLEQSSASKVLIAAARDKAALQAQVRKVLGSAARTVKVGAEEMLVSADEENLAASFADGYLIMGEEEDVRRCLAAHAAGKALKNSTSFAADASSFASEPPFVTTAALDDAPARAVVQHVSGKGGSRHESATVSTEPLRPYSLSRTRLTPEGLNKVTRSSFGLIGEMIEFLAHTETGGSDNQR